MPADLQAQHLRKEFPTRGEPLLVLRDVSLSLSAGENTAIVGPSGCGKSTLLHLLGTLDRPTAGEYRLLDQEPWKLDEPGLAHFRNHRVGFIFQDHHLLPQLSVLENVLVPALAEGPPSEETVKRAKQLIERVGLKERSEHRPAELSGGERQRAGVARALLLKPALLLADEPTGNLDRTSAASVAKLLLELQQEERTMLVLVTHSQELASQMQRQYELNDGQLRSVGA
jgi:lipoprotein-releasing system ATP-binding protein